MKRVKCVIVANDSTVKGGSYYPVNNIIIIYNISYIYTYITIHDEM